MIPDARHHGYEARRALLVTVAALAGAAMLYELTVQADQGFRAYLNAAIDAGLVVASLVELRNRARTEYLFLALASVFGGLSILGSIRDTAYTNFGPEATLTLLVLVGLVYLGTRDRLTSWPVYTYSVLVAAYSVAATLVNEMSSNQVLAMILLGVGAQMIVMALMHQMMVRLHQTSAAQANQARIQRALAECSEALLSRGAEQPLKTALAALLDATEAAYSYIDVNREGPNGVTWEIVADARHDPVRADAVSSGDYAEMQEAEALLRAGKPAEVLTSDLPEPLRTHYETVGIKAELMAPIRMGERWVGSIGYTDHAREGTWSDAEVEGLMRAADMVGAYWQREAAREGLMELAQAKDRFIAAVSHELRTPLSAVVGFAGELAQRIADYSPQEISEMANFVHTQAVELTELVNDLLTAERAASGNLTISSGDVMLLEECTKAVDSILGHPPIDVSGPEVAARADGLRTRQILRNLITNAVKYGGETIKVEVSASDGTATVTVSDDGAGVQAIDGERIFDPYYRAAGSESKPDSVGLGLSVARQLARLMKGDLVYRRENGWTVFELTLPLGKVPAVMMESVGG